MIEAFLLTKTSDDGNGYALQRQCHSPLGGHSHNKIYAMSGLNLPAKEAVVSEMTFVSNLFIYHLCFKYIV
jgi:hypothetical protein